MCFAPALYAIHVAMRHFQYYQLLTSLHGRVIRRKLIRIFQKKRATSVMFCFTLMSEGDTMCPVHFIFPRTVNASSGVSELIPTFPCNVVNAAQITDSNKTIKQYNI